MRRCLVVSALLALSCSTTPSDSLDIADTPSPEAGVLDIVDEWDWGYADTGADGEVRTEVVPEVELLAPAKVPDGHPVPVVVRVSAEGVPAFGLSSGVAVTGNGDSVGTLNLRRGMGSVSLALSESTTLSVSLPGAQTDRSVSLMPAEPSRTLEGELADDSLIWGPDEFIRLTDEVIVPAGATLTVKPGTVVLADGKEDIVVLGSLQVEGTADSPVLFSAWSLESPWGGIRVLGGEASLTYAFVTAGGGDGSHVFGHSNSQAVLFVDGGHLDLAHVFVMDNVGKGLGSESASLSVVDSLISRCDTGGELKKSQVVFHRTWFLEMPNADGEEVDDDNDGIYLHNPPDELAAEKPSATLTECVFAVGKDDGIDHNGSRIEVSDSFIEGFAHEGIACSKNNWVKVSNTLVRNCQQGIEAGYGSPAVTVDHCTVVDNEVGFRLGDSYERVVSGTLTVTNSIAVNNSQTNVWNFSRRDEGPLLENVSVSFSIVDSPEWDDQQDNLPGLPDFDAGYHLAPGSIGIGAASDGLDMGLL